MREIKLMRYVDSTVFNHNLLHLDSLALFKDTWQMKEIPPGLAAHHKGDLFGLLFDLDIPRHDHLAVMHLNNITSPFDYDGKTLLLKVPILPPLTRMN